MGLILNGVSAEDQPEVYSYFFSDSFPGNVWSKFSDFLCICSCVLISCSLMSGSQNGKKAKNEGEKGCWSFKSPGSHFSQRARSLQQ